MVLEELGEKLTRSFQRLTGSHALDEQLLDDIIKDVMRALLEADVNVRVCAELRDRIKARINIEELTGTDAAKVRFVQKVMVGELVAMVDPGHEPYVLRKGQPNVIMFVGLQGAGKTTTIAKYAHYYARKGWKTAMVCADTFRAGAFDQLRQNAARLRIPFYGSYTEADPVAIAREGVAQFRDDGFEVIIVDTSGRHSQEEGLFQEMRQLAREIRPDNIVFVLDATQGQAVHDQAEAFRSAVDVGGCIITKLDGHAKGGGALSAVAQTGSPILFLGLGEGFEDLEIFRPQSFVSRMLGMGDISGLMEELESVMDESKQRDLMDKMMKGTFTLFDMKGQLEMIMSLGPIDKVMSMIPGMPPGMLDMLKSQDGNRISRFIVMMDSMTRDEMECKVDLLDSPSRIRRIARGSGTHEGEVIMLVKMHKQFGEIFKRMGQSGMMDDKAMRKAMQNNPQGVMNQLSQMMDPRMLQQMGGTQNIMNMMSQMMGGGGGGGGMPDLSSMMGGGGGGMPDLSSMMGGGGGGMPDLSSMFGGGGMPDLSSMMGRGMNPQQQQQQGGRRPRRK